MMSVFYIHASAERCCTSPLPEQALDLMLYPINNSQIYNLLAIISQLEIKYGPSDSGRKTSLGLIIPRLI